VQNLIHGGAGSNATNIWAKDILVIVESVGAELN